MRLFHKRKFSEGHMCITRDNYLAKFVSCSERPIFPLAVQVYSTEFTFGDLGNYTYFKGKANMNSSDIIGMKYL